MIGTSDEGARLFYRARTGFEAARRLDHPRGGADSGGWHGHSFRVSARAGFPGDWAPFPGAEPDTLEEHLACAVEPLDYSLLNHHVQVPGDDNLAVWIRDRVAVPGLDRLALAGPADRGVVLEAGGGLRAWCRYRFEAAHRLPNVPPEHKCGRMHGHGFEALVHVVVSGGESSVEAQQRVDGCWRPLHARLDRACLNDLPGLENPTSELISAWIWARLNPVLEGLTWVTVKETAGAGCHHDGGVFRIWKERGFESAIRHGGAPDDDRRSRLHGHSYRLRLHLAAGLDQVLGWVMDYGDIKTVFQPVYQSLDHRSLHELDGGEGGSAAGVLHWVRERSASSLPALDRLDLDERPGCGATLCWGGERASRAP